jgi:TRAP-type C4-dicarboxylate transport system substrate-binding protein
MNKRNFIASISLAVASVFVVAPAAAQEFAKLVGERTNGKISITVFPA